MTRPILGDNLKIARIAKKDSGSLLNQRVGRINTKENFSDKFAYYVFHSKNFINLMQKELLGSDPPNISSKMFENLEIAFPPVEEQQYIGKILATVDSKLHVLIEKKQSYQELKKGLMQKLLTGKIRVNQLEEKQMELWNG